MINTENLVTAKNYNNKAIQELAQQYNLTCEHVGLHSLKITSARHEWVCYIDKELDVLQLEHVNEEKNRNKKYHTHKQRDYYDFEFMFKSIKDHDKWKYRNRGRCKLEKAFDCISGKASDVVKNTYYMKFNH
jgi:hypothetical protein